MTYRLVLVALASAAMFGCAATGSSSSSSSPEIETMKTQLAAVASARALEMGHLQNFDDLDFNVYSGQRWELLSRSHSPDITVHYPDGHISKGLPAHIDELKPLFLFAPDTNIKEHPVRIASGDWTAVTGTTQGTFSRPMDIGGGKTLAPTGKAFKLSMVTIGHWKDGVMDEEWIFWDNLAFMKQIGLAP